MGRGKPVKSWNFANLSPGLEGHGIFITVLY